MFFLVLDGSCFPGHRSRKGPHKHLGHFLLDWPLSSLQHPPPLPLPLATLHPPSGTDACSACYSFCCSWPLHAGPEGCVSTTGGPGQEPLPPTLQGLLPRPPPPHSWSQSQIVHPSCPGYCPLPTVSASISAPATTSCKQWPHDHCLWGLGIYSPIQEIFIEFLL